MQNARSPPLPALPIVLSQPCRSDKDNDSSSGHRVDLGLPNSMSHGK